MEIGKPQRVYRVEPVKTPVPAKRAPERAPSVKPREPEKVPAR